MLTLECVDVNDAFGGIVSHFNNCLAHSQRRGIRVQEVEDGKIMKIDGPVTLSYTNPTRRVLFNPGLDVNPFETLECALVDLEGLLSRRLQNQLTHVVDYLRDAPQGQRAVVELWNSINDSRNLGTSLPITKDLCLFFEIDDTTQVPELNTTLVSRSRDVRYFPCKYSFLQQYLAVKLGLGLGKHYHFINNLYIHSRYWKPKEWFMSPKTMTMHSPVHHTYENDVKQVVPLVQDITTFDRELRNFNGYSEAYVSEPFLAKVAQPMALAYRHHHDQDYEKALEAIGYVESDDWRLAGTNWLKQRKLEWLKHQRELEKKTTSGTSTN